MLKIISLFISLYKFYTYINYRNSETNEFKIIFGNGKPESYDSFVGTIEK